jgi:hypothetical protein
MKKLVSILLVLAMLCSVGPAFAWGGHGGHSRYGGGRYRYYGGHYWLGGAIVSGLIMGAIIESLNRPQIVVVNGGRYYYDGNYYYQQCPGGYVVVNPLTVAAQPEVMTVRVEGSSVVLVRKDNGFIGPNGEFYSVLPTKDQLQAIYGR